MKNMTIEELAKFDRFRIANEPSNFDYLSVVERRAWVAKQLAIGDFLVEKSLSIRDVLHLGSNLGEYGPNLFLYKILLETYDPAEVQEHVALDCHAILFLHAYGLDRARPFVSNKLWLDAMVKAAFTPLEIETREQIKLLLNGRGPEQIVPLIKDKATGLLFLEIFGVESLSHLSKDLAQKVKGRHLEDELGL